MCHALVLATNMGLLWNLHLSLLVKFSAPYGSNLNYVISVLHNCYVLGTLRSHLFGSVHLKIRFSFKKIVTNISCPPLPGDTITVISVRLWNFKDGGS